MTAPGFVARLKAKAAEAEAQETAWRREAAQRTTALARARSDAYRRLNLMEAVARAAAGAKDETAGLAAAASALKSELGWDSDSAARIEVLERFVPVARAALADKPDDEAVLAAVAEFERWYETSRGTNFWTLFDQYSPERPVVDF